MNRVSVFVLLLHAHDRVWNDMKNYSFRDRVAACKILWKAATEIPAETSFDWGEL